MAKKVKRKGHARKGFAAMTPAMRKKISERGGIRAHQLGKAHQWTPEEAREMGRLGGLAKSREDEPPV